MYPALYYKEQENKQVKCILCPHNCVIALGKTGVCKSRKNQDGKLFSGTYGKFSSINLDPIEKKPLYNFYPGSQILSIGSLGCNLKCSFCQNWEISQAGFEELITKEVKLENIVKLAGENKSIGIAYTYNEPLINYEWIKDCCELMHKNNLKNVFVTNGYINQEPLKKLAPFIDAANIDVKSFSVDFYASICRAKLSPVLETVKYLVAQKKHIELTTLLITGINDSESELEKLTDWIAELNPEIPMHFSRYFPMYHYEEPPTDLKSMVKAYEIAKKKLKYVYLGNIQEMRYNNTYCPKCGEIAIERSGYFIKNKTDIDNKCQKCSTVIALKK